MIHYPQSEIKDKDLCDGCTRDDCTGCPNQSETDRLLGINPLAESAHNFFNDEEEECDPQEPIPMPIEATLLPAPTQPLPTQDIPKRRVGRPKKEVDPSIPKRSPGAPKGNLNALKHGLYVNGCSVSNTTPFERAELSDLKKLIEYVKNYITKAYENGLTLKSTEEINHTLRDISLASIALTRLLSVHNENISSGFPSSLKVDDRKSTLKLIEFYQDKVATYQELTTPSSDSTLGE